MKKTFLNHVPIVGMIQCRTAEECIAKIERSLSAGADAIGVQLCRLQKEDRSEKTLRRIFDACGDQPIYVTSYRYGESEGMGDEECAELLLRALTCGATLLDIPGDLFAPNSRQLTTEKCALEKQRRWIDTLHAAGGEVLISTHDFRDLSGDEVFSIAEAQAEQGADILKIVVKSGDVRRLTEYLSIIQRVKTELHKQILLLDSGACSTVLRKLGGFLGSCMVLGVESHNALDTPAQPNLKELLQIRNAMEGIT